LQTTGNENINDPDRIKEHLLKFKNENDEMLEDFDVKKLDLEIDVCIREIGDIL
jgi:hypothetical protein